MNLNRIYQVDCKYIVKDSENWPDVLKNLELMLQSKIIEKKDNKRLHEKDARIRLLKTSYQNPGYFDFTLK